MKKRERGLTLIELMVSMLIASFMMLALTGLYVGNLQTTSLARNIGSSTEAGSFGGLLISRYLSLAGHINYFSGSGIRQVVNKVVVQTGSIQNNQIVNGVGFDTVTVEYEAPQPSTGEASYRNCSGEDVDPGVLVQETFSVQEAGNLGLVLQCVSTNPLTGAQDEAASLISGVQMFQVQYGLASSGTSEDVAVYLNGDDVMALGQSNVNERIRTIRYQLVVDSGRNVGTTGTQVRSIYDSGNVNVSSDARSFGSTIVLYNANHSRVMR